MRLQLRSQELGGFPVLLLFSDFVQEEEVSARENVVDVVFIDGVGANGAVVGDEVVHTALDEIEILVVARILIDALDSFQHQTIIIGPLCRVARLVFRRVTPERSHCGSRRALRDRFGLRRCAKKSH